MEVLQQVAPLLSALVALAGFWIGRVSAKKEEGKQEATIVAELEHIKRQLDGVDKKIDRQEQWHTEVMMRLTAVEESAKQAHHRINEIREHCCGD